MILRFGTDGWRAGIADQYTFENLRRVAFTSANVLLSVSRQGPEPAEGQARTLFVGYDRRFRSEDFAAAAAEEACRAGAEVLLSKVDLPTPAISLACKNHPCSGAFMITASHNPARDNGFKIKLPGGLPAGPEVTERVEGLLESALGQAQGLGGKVKGPGSVNKADILGPYLEALESESSRLRGGTLKGVVDSMHGVGSDHLERLLSGRVALSTVRGSRDPLFGGNAPEPVEKNLQPLLKAVLEKGAAFGLATDGDADRISLADGKGRFVSAHKVLLLLLYGEAALGKGRGEVAHTVSGTVLFNRLASDYGLKVHTTAVGFKHIAKLMVERDLLMGGEESGGIGFRGHIPERDGLFCGLKLIRLFQETGKGPESLIEDLEKKYGRSCYRRVDRRLSPEAAASARKRLESAVPERMGSLKVDKLDRTDGFKFLFGEQAWLLIRGSGTEPLLRFYAEGPDENTVSGLLEAGQKACGLEP